MAERYSMDTSVVVVAGKIGSGKSTALNNLFDLSLEARSSPTSVTQKVTESLVQRSGASVRVLDTPGLGGVSMKTEIVAQQIASAVRGSDFTLIYCLPVKPSDTLTETDKLIVKSLQKYLGKKVWDKCVLLLTFSDIALQREFADHQVDEYLSFLRGHIQAFHKILKECGADVPRITGTFDQDRMQMNTLQESLGEIVAVPVMKSKNVAGGNMLNSNWMNQVLSEVSRVSQQRRRRDVNMFPALGELFQNPRQIIAMAVQEAREYPLRAVAGTLVGAGVGGLMGWYFYGRDEMLIGSGVGAVLGIMITFLVFLMSRN